MVCLHWCKLQNPNWLAFACECAWMLFHKFNPSGTPSWDGHLKRGVTKYIPSMKLYSHKHNVECDLDSCVKAAMFATNIILCIGNLVATLDDREWIYWRGLLWLLFIIAISMFANLVGLPIRNMDTNYINHWTCSISFRAYQTTNWHLGTIRIRKSVSFSVLC